MRLNVHVKKRSGAVKQLSVQVNPNADSVRDLKSVVARRVHTAPKRLKMEFMGQNMADSYILSAFRIQRHPSTPVTAVVSAPTRKSKTSPRKRKTRRKTRRKQKTRTKRRR